MKRLNINLKDRKVLTLGLCLVAVCVFTLTIAYAALNAVLTISGSAQVTSANWDIHLANPKVTSGSATTDIPSITSGKTLTFNTTLNMPGDFYEFTVDVVNGGSLDAMIDKVTKTPELTAEQAKYLKYEVSYANGESISSKQNIASGVTMPIKVRVEYRKDLTSSDLPTGQVQLTLGLVLDYVQSDGSGTTVNNNGILGGSLITVSGNLTDKGTIVTIDNEKFYTIGIEGDNVKLLSMFNLYVGGLYSDESWVPYGAAATNRQDSTMKGWDNFEEPYYGTINFSDVNYWHSGGLKAEYGTSYPAYVYDSNSNLYTYIENYKNILDDYIYIDEARLITAEELVDLKCDLVEEMCDKAPEWVYSTSYYSGSAHSVELLWAVYNDSYMGRVFATGYGGLGLRPVIEIPISEFE